jgi:hypothetical protein
VLVVTASLALVVGVISIGGEIRATAIAQKNRATAMAQPRPTATPETPGITIASSGQLDLPDPFLLSVGRKYYLYVSSAFADPTHSNVPVLAGTPGHWGPASEAMPSVPAWALPASAGAPTWDPYVVRLGNRYVMYFAPQLSNRQPATHCIGVAVSASPTGPFVAVGGPPLVCQTQLGGDIDAQLFSDPHGPRGATHPNYLVWKSDNNNLPGSGPTTIWAAPLSDDGLALAGKAVAIFQPDQAWEEPVLEAPQMVEAPNGTDWLFFSGGGGFFTPNYAIGAAKCAGPLGGCSDTSAGPLIASNAQGSGPGEETVFVGADHSTWLLYNPWHTGESQALLRPAEAARIGWNRQGPFVAEANRFLAPSQ